MYGNKKPYRRRSRRGSRGYNAMGRVQRSGRMMNYLRRRRVRRRSYKKGVKRLPAALQRLIQSYIR